MDLKVDSDSLSEIFESDYSSPTEIRVGSKLHQKRISVDRRKLMQMLAEETEAPNLAHTFFHKIMEDTNTIIHWPKFSSFGRMIKIDPRITIIGLPEDTRTAKRRILNVLSINRYRVTIEMEVDYKDHAYIIGKEGSRIRPVMEETHCHIHFPHLNLISTTKKSNQVTITGDIEYADHARRCIRYLTPLQLSFELLHDNSQMTPHIDTSYVSKVEEKYDVYVTLECKPNLQRTCVSVQGSDGEIKKLKKATWLLMKFMCGDLSYHIPIQLCMEIPLLHLDNSTYYALINAIMQNTQTQITLPDVRIPIIPSFNNIRLVIRGNIDKVYLARQQLLGLLPLVVSFKLPETSDYMLDPQKLVNIASNLGVTIKIRPQSKRNCIIRGIEQYASNIYEARNCILGINKPGIKTNIPHMWQPLIQVAPLVGIEPQPQFMYNDMIYNLPGHTGNDALGQFSSNTVFLKRRTSSGSSPITSSKDIFSPYYEAEESDDSAVSDLSSRLSDRNNSSQSDYRRKSDEYFTTTDFDEKRDKYRQLFTTPDFDQKRVAGIRAMHIREVKGYRIPTNTWSGYGISHTSPAAPQLYDQDKTICQKEVADPISTLLTKSNNILESTRASMIDLVINSTWTDVPSMLACLGLEKYIEVFISHKIDLLIFRSLNEDDLIKLGVTAFGARRKMMLVLSDMNKRFCSLSAIPGAERRNKW